jgi:hypothetical protein
MCIAHSVGEQRMLTESRPHNMVHTSRRNTKVRSFLQSEWAKLAIAMILVGLVILYLWSWVYRPNTFHVGSLRRDARYVPYYLARKHPYVSGNNGDKEL